MYCSTVIAIKSPHFVYTFIALLAAKVLLRQTSQQEKGCSSQCCCTAVHSRKRGAFKKMCKVFGRPD